VAKRDAQLLEREKQLLELGNQNSVLHLRLSCFVREVEALRERVSKKDAEISSKKEEIEEYCRAL
jgi:hypothetical protein